ncbi:hypothetical protein PsYK624_170840 [Phanerochaete sordida]|uniref:Uncharacterized protein n=1 Tax=Phanerochaete sordida TaxID=48140 RepID=A0A9P3LPN9_9APHY|nr:hypothetical protein PsYK624_170840 [Phanerochaete sordida]
MMRRGSEDTRGPRNGGVWYFPSPSEAWLLPDRLTLPPAAALSPHPPPRRLCPSTARTSASPRSCSESCPTCRHCTSGSPDPTTANLCTPTGTARAHLRPPRHPPISTAPTQPPTTRPTLSCRRRRRAALTSDTHPLTPPSRTRITAASHATALVYCAQAGVFLDVRPAPNRSPARAVGRRFATKIGAAIPGRGPAEGATGGSETDEGFGGVRGERREGTGRDDSLLIAIPRVSDAASDLPSPAADGGATRTRLSG